MLGTGVPPGEHRVRVGIGDASYASTNTITVEGVNLFDSRPSPRASSQPLPPRPYGLNELKKVFGEKCNPEANDGRAYWPSAGGRGAHGYVYFHARLADVIGNEILSKINTRGKANDYGVWGYACRFFEQSQSSQESLSTKWSVHSSAAVDTNTLRNASHESVPKLVARAPGSSSGPWRMGPRPRKIWTRFDESCRLRKPWSGLAAR